jgi:hypothetical protein
MDSYRSRDVLFQRYFDLAMIMYHSYDQWASRVVGTLFVDMKDITESIIIFYTLGGTQCLTQPARGYRSNWGYHGGIYGIQREFRLDYTVQYSNSSVLSSHSLSGPMISCF